MADRPFAVRLNAEHQLEEPVGTKSNSSNASKFSNASKSSNAPRSSKTQMTVRDDVDIFAADAQIISQPAVTKRSYRLGAIFLSAFSGLILMVVGSSLVGSVSQLMIERPALGWVAAGLAMLALLTLMMIIIREFIGLFRLARVGRLRKDIAICITEKNSEAAKTIVGRLADIYQARPETASGRAALKTHDEMIIDAQDRLALAERVLLEPLDERAKLLTVEAARQVSAVTALSPRAMIDIAFVLYASLRLIRRIAELYGVRMGPIGSLRLISSVGQHLLVTGGLAAGETVLQQLLGQGLAARLSAKLGEGVLNGLLTARVGVAAIEVCRPSPFIKAAPPRVRDIAAHLFSRVEST